MEENTTVKVIFTLGWNITFLGKSNGFREKITQQFTLKVVFYSRVNITPVKMNSLIDYQHQNACDLLKFNFLQFAI